MENEGGREGYKRKMEQIKGDGAWSASKGRKFGKEEEVLKNGEIGAVRGKRGKFIEPIGNGGEEKYVLKSMRKLERLGGN